MGYIKVYFSIFKLKNKVGAHKEPPRFKLFLKINILRMKLQLVFLQKSD